MCHTVWSRSAATWRPSPRFQKTVWCRWCLLCFHAYFVLRVLISVPLTFILSFTLSKGAVFYCVLSNQMLHFYVLLNQTLCSLLDCLLTEDNTPVDSPRELYEIYFVFACVWAFGGALFQDHVCGDWIISWLTQFYCNALFHQLLFSQHLNDS